MQVTRLALSAPLWLCAPWALALPIDQPGCEHVNEQQCVAQALDAMGGRDRLKAITSVAYERIGHTAIMEQSYRQAPFLTSYERAKVTLDLAGRRERDEVHGVWPESDPDPADFQRTLIINRDGGGYHGDKGDSPCGLASLDEAAREFALGPLRLLITAAAAEDLHYAEPETLRSSAHAVVTFHWNGLPVRVLLNAHNHLPDAIETTQQFRDFWYFWGDVKQRVVWDNWKFIAGVVYPTNEIIERNDAQWASTQALNIQFNPPLNDADFALDAKVAGTSAQGKGWERTFKDDSSQVLADGIVLYSGAWNATVVRQTDGIVLLETPISSNYTRGLYQVARQRFPDAPIKAALSTSDSWPHVGGVRFDVASGTPTYILDLNRPLLERMLAAPHTLVPDALQQSPRRPDWKLVAGKVDIGSGANRLELYPLRGAATERQYMVYFPAHRLLYASDTLVIDADSHALYAPELMREVRAEVEREHLDVDTVYAMHQGPTPWKDVVTLLDKLKS